MSKSVKKKTDLASIKEEINKVHGDTAMMAMADMDLEVKRIPTGVLALDQILDGGFPVRKMVELFGPHGCGKSAIAYSFIAQAQKHGGGQVALIDLEDAFDPRMAENSGIDLDRLMISYPESAEDALSFVEMLLGAEDLSAIVVDSVAGLTPSAEIAGDFGDSHVGLTARLLSQALRKLATTLRTEQSEIIIVWINQIREKIGVMGYGPKTDSTGGRGLKFWCGTRVEVTRVGQVKSGEDVIGHAVRVKNVKSRSTSPMQNADFNIYYETGISNESTLIELAVQSGRFVKKGAWYADTVTGENVGQGELNVIKKLREDPELYQSLVDTVL